MLRGILSLLCVLTALLPASGPGVVPSPQSLAGGSVRSAPEIFSAGPLPFFYDLYTFRGQADSTTVVAAFAVPAGRLEKEGFNARVRYRFDVTLVLADTALGSVSRTDDSVFVGVTRPLADEHLLFTHVEVQAAPSGSTLQRVIMSDAKTPGVGQLYSSSFPIPDYSGRHLMLSDIALGQPDADAGWKRGAATLALLPTSQFPASAFDVYYEIYNLPYGHTYVTEIAVEHADDSGTARVGDRRPVRLRFAGESAARADGSLPELRRVETSLANGRYRITVTIRDGVTGQTASRSRVFEVNEWQRGATLVPAWPHRSALRVQSRRSKPFRDDSDRSW
jgi:hypothetical protein